MKMVLVLSQTSSKWSGYWNIVPVSTQFSVAERLQFSATPDHENSSLLCHVHLSHSSAPPPSHYSRDKHCGCLFKSIQFPRVPLLSRYLLKHFVAVGLGVSLCSLGSGTSFILCFWVKSFLTHTLLFAIANNQAHIYSQLKEHFLLVGIDILPQICLMFSFCWTMLKRMM